MAFQPKSMLNGKCAEGQEGLVVSQTKVYNMPPTGRDTRNAFPDRPIDGSVHVRLLTKHEKVEHEAEGRAGEDQLGQQRAQFEVPRVRGRLVGAGGGLVGRTAAARLTQRPETRRTASAAGRRPPGQVPHRRTVVCPSA